MSGGTLTPRGRELREQVEGMKSLCAEGKREVLALVGKIVGEDLSKKDTVVLREGGVYLNSYGKFYVYRKRSYETRGHCLVGSHGGFLLFDSEDNTRRHLYNDGYRKYIGQLRDLIPPTNVYSVIEEITP